MKATFHPKPAHFEKKSQVCPNSLIFHRNMSDSAIRFILALNGIWMNCRTWVPIKSDLEKRLNWYPKKMSNVIKECVKFGYLKVRQFRGKKGRFAPIEFEFDIEGKYLEECPHNEYEPHTQNDLRLNEENTHSEECPEDMFSTNDQTRLAVNDLLPCSSKKPNLVLLDNQETNKQQEENLFVCSLDENQKKIKDLLKPHDFPDKEIERMFGLPAEQIEDALLAFEQYRTGKDIENTIGFIKKAILSAWKPNKKKINETEERERIEKESIDKIDENTRFAEKVIQKISYKFNQNFEISFSGLAIILKSKTGCYPLNLLDDDFKDVLDWFVNSN